jgi:hypothetical protein
VKIFNVITLNISHFICPASGGWEVRGGVVISSIRTVPVLHCQSIHLRLIKEFHNEFKDVANVLNFSVINFFNYL